MAVTLLVKAAPPLGAKSTDDRSPRSLIRRALQLDWMGAILILGGVTTLVMALQWGGNTKPWNSAAVITCLVVAVVLVIALITWQMYMKEKAMVPTVVFKYVYFQMISLLFCSLNFELSLCIRYMCLLICGSCLHVHDRICEL